MSKQKTRFYNSYRIEDRLFVNGEVKSYNDRIHRFMIDCVQGKKRWLYKSEKEAFKVFMGIVRSHSSRKYKQCWLVRTRNHPKVKTYEIIAVFYTMFYDNLGNKYERIYYLCKNNNHWANGDFNPNLRTPRGSWKKEYDYKR